MSSSPQPGRPVIFGEVLFDVFPDGASVLGGAAFNVAWSLCGLGLDPLFVSRVGDDEHGRSVLDAMRRWQMDTSAVQIDPDHPTGVVSVAFSDGEPSYDIVSDRAYDHIDREAASESVRRIEPVLLYHGTLALRSAASRAALVGLRQVVRGPIFLDVNLRFPWWTLEDVERLLRAADHAKLNVHGFAVLGRKLGVPEDASLEDRSRRLLDVCDLDQLIITRGAEGAILVARGGAVLGAEPSGRADRRHGRCGRCFQRRDDLRLPTGMAGLSPACACRRLRGARLLDPRRDERRSRSVPRYGGRHRRLKAGAPDAVVAIGALRHKLRGAADASWKYRGCIERRDRAFRPWRRSVRLISGAPHPISGGGRIE